MMDPAEAAQIGAKLATAPPSKEQKAALAVQMVNKLHPAMKADTAQNAAQLAVDLAVAKHHHVEPALKRSK
jgi:hypothetical protein